MARPAFKGCLAHAHRGEQETHTLHVCKGVGVSMSHTDDADDRQPTHACKGFRWVTSGGNHACAHVGNSGPFVPKGPPTCASFRTQKYSLIGG